VRQSRPSRIVTGTIIRDLDPFISSGVFAPGSITGRGIEFFLRGGMTICSQIISPEHGREPKDLPRISRIEHVRSLQARRDPDRPESPNKSTSPVEIKGFSTRHSTVRRQTGGCPGRDLL
jgi:hypothetical protein